MGPAVSETGAQSLRVKRTILGKGWVYSESSAARLRFLAAATASVPCVAPGGQVSVGEAACPPLFRLPINTLGTARACAH